MSLKSGLEPTKGMGMFTGFQEGQGRGCLGNCDNNRHIHVHTHTHNFFPTGVVVEPGTGLLILIH